MLNLVHKVGVLFHANDRLSRHMDGIADRFVKLEERQKVFEKSQKNIERLNDQVGASFTRLAKTESRADLQMMQSQKALWAQRQGIVNATMRQEQQRNAFGRQQFEKQVAAERKLLEIEVDRRTKVAALDAKYATQREAEQARAVRTAATASTQLRNLALRESAIIRGGLSAPLNMGSRAVIMDRIQTRRSEIGVLEQERNRRMLVAAQSALPGITSTNLMVDRFGAPTVTAVGASETALNRAREMARVAAAAETRSIRSLQTLMKADEQRLEQSHKLAAIQSEQARTQQRMAAESTASAARLNQLNRVRLANLAEINTAQQLLASATANNDRAAMERSQVLYEEKRDYNERLIEQQRIAYEADSAIHTRRMHNIEAEARARSTELRISQVELRMEQRREAILAREVALRKQMSSMFGTSAGLVGSGVGTLLGAGFGGAILAGGAYHLSKEAAGVDTRELDLRMALKSKPGLFDSLMTGIAGRNLMMPGGFRMSEKEQVSILQDMIASGINPKHAEGNLLAIAPLLRLSQLRAESRGGKVDEESFVKDLSFSFERMNLQTPESINTAAQRIAQGMAVSGGKMNPKFMKDYLTKFSPFARQMKLNLSDVPTMEFAATAFPSGGQASTEFAGVFSMLARGGTNEVAKTLFKAMVQSKLLQYSAKPTPIRDLQGHIVLDSNGKSKMLPGVFDFAGKTPIAALRGVIENLGRLAHISKSDLLAGNLNKEQTGRMSQYLTTAFPAMRGGKLVSILADPAMIKRVFQEQQLTKGAPNLTAQLRAYAETQGFKVKNLAAELEQLGTVVGRQLSPHIQRLIDQSASWAKWLREILHDHPGAINNLATFAKIVVGIGVAAGLAKIGFGGLNFVMLGLPALFGKKVLGGIASTIASNATAARIGFAMTSVLSRGIAVVAVGTLGLALGMKIGEMFRNAIDSATGGKFSSKLYDLGYNLMPDGQKYPTRVPRVRRLPGGLPVNGLHTLPGGLPATGLHTPGPIVQTRYNVEPPTPTTFTEHTVGESTQTRKYEICVKVESNHPLDHHIQKKIGAAMEDFVKKSGQGLPNMGTNTRTANGLTTPYPGSR